MKKISAILSSFLMCACFAVSATACGGSDPENEKDPVCPKDVLPTSYSSITANNDKVVTTPNFTLLETVTENSAAFTLPKLVGDNMLLQAYAVNRVWGKTTESGKIAVRFTEDTTKTSTVFYGTIEDGAFEVYTGSFAHGGKYKVEIITESGVSTSVRNVTFGELFIGGGQSNMGWRVGQCYDGDVTTLLYADEIAEAYNENIRLFGVSPLTSQTPIDEVQTSSTGGWTIAKPNAVRDFSACAYFFAAELQSKLDIPVGMVVSCMGGTNVFTWTPEEEVKDSKGTENITDQSLYYNAMLYPIRKLNPRGVIWYQGEGDNGNIYAHNLGQLIKGWRRTFVREDLSFAIVQLPRYADDDQNWFARRNGQKTAATTIPNCTYSVNLDLGLMVKDIAEGDNQNPLGIHPYDKKSLGERLAHAVLKDIYGAEGVWSSPVLKEISIKGDKAIIEYENVGKGLKLHGTYGFEVAGADGNFKPAVPTLISKTKIELTCEEVKDIKSIRYGAVSNVSSKAKSYRDSVCVYNSKADGTEYPAEQFWQ